MEALSLHCSEPAHRAPAPSPSGRCPCRAHQQKRLHMAALFDRRRGRLTVRQPPRR
ncbi:hypothetical protein Tharo_0504 [Thauera aromatica K172]|uniref:Uncharacterized protein n=1 Tax=Thauera aromatica K172 TaxID=44139 RepID=A0A2R4BJR5_THAAR|nr:hypothetical protein Tharo_0504 [Thauera aromatica K172]